MTRDQDVSGHSSPRGQAPFSSGRATTRSVTFERANCADICASSRTCCMATQTLPTTETAHDAFPINGTDYVEFWVGNAKQASHFYRAAFGFQLVAYRGPETGVRDRASYLMQQGKIRLVLTTALGPEAPIAEHVQHARRWCEGLCALGGRRALCVHDRRRSRRDSEAGAARRARRRRRGRDRRDRNVWRHDSLARRATELSRHVPARLPHRERLAFNRARSASSTSTTAWATSSSGR